MFARLGIILILILAATLAATALPPPPLPVLPRAGEASGLGMEDPGGVYRLTEAAGGPCYCSDTAQEDIQGYCPPRPREQWAVGLAHWYGCPEDGYAGRIMANGQPMNPQALTIAVRVDLLDAFPLDTTVKLSSYCGVITATVTDAMPMIPAFAQGVIVDVSPAVAERLFCEGYGHNGEGIAYGEELVLVEIIKD